MKERLLDYQQQPKTHKCVCIVESLFIQKIGSNIEEKEFRSNAF